MFCTATYEELKDRWSVIPRGGNVSHDIDDMASEYINSAQEDLNMDKPWPWLINLRTLSLSGQSVTLSYPTERIEKIYTDDNGDGKPDKFYYERSSFTSDGYYITKTFTKAAGLTRVITFYNAPSSSPIVRSRIVLPNMSADADISFFPKNLIIHQAMLLYLIDVGRINTSEYSKCEKRLEDALGRATRYMINENTQDNMPVKDFYNRNVRVEQYSLDGGPGHSAGYGYPNDMDF